MFAWRTVYTIKPGRLAAAQALMAELLNGFEPDQAYANTSSRMYVSRSGTGDVLLYEETWPTIEMHDQWHAAWGQSPEAVTFVKAWREVAEASSSEVWEVREWKW